MAERRPRLAVTMGDANGVGPEILLRRFAAGDLGDDVVAYGDAAILRAGADLLGLAAPIRALGHPAEAETGALNVVDAGELSAADLAPGRPNARVSAAALAYVYVSSLGEHWSISWLPDSLQFRYAYLVL